MYSSFSVCVSFLFLQEKGGFSLCLCLGFDKRIIVDVCRGGIQLHHEGFSLFVELASSESLLKFNFNYQNPNFIKIPILLDNWCSCLLIFSSTN